MAPTASSVLKKALVVGTYLFTHIIKTLSLIAVVQLAQYVLRLLGDPKLLDRIPIRYIFDVMDLGLLVEFAVFGTLDALWILREN